jgi:hypothetical protein
MRTLLPADSGDVRLGRGHCKKPPTGFAIYRPGSQGDRRWMIQIRNKIEDRPE